MTTGFKLDTSSSTIVVAGLGLVLAYYFLKKQGAAIAGAVGNVNAGTPYAGYGIVGTLGNAANKASGGYLAGQGAQLGGWLYNMVNPGYDPNAATGGAPALPVDFGVSGNWDGSTSNAPAPIPVDIALPTSKSTVQDNYWNTNPMALLPVA